MQGHDHIIAMRRRGYVPASVVMVFDPALAPDQQFRRLRPDVAYIAIEPADRIDRLDLRCLVGLPVIVIGDVGDRVRETVAAVAKAGAKRIVASRLERERPGAETFRTVEHYDTTKGAQWQTC